MGGGDCSIDTRASEKMSTAESVAQFLSVTGASPEAAAFYLESTEGDVAAAVDAYFASDGAVPSQRAEDPAPPAARSALAGPDEGPAPATRRPTAAAAASRRVRGFADLGGDDSESDNDDSNEYYAGGQKSGQVVKGGDGRSNQVDALFDRARQAGADVGTSADLQPSQASTTFRGKARTLGGGEQEAREVPNLGPSQPVMHTITVWANDVFTVDDGEPRDIMDPANRLFLEALGRGECPPELAPPNHNTPVNINLIRKGQAYEAPPKPRHAAFSGSSRTLADPERCKGSCSRAVSRIVLSSVGSSQSPNGSHEPSLLPGTSAAPPASARQEAGPSTQWEGVDDSKPTTSLQLRLADGSRLVARFNHDQTVADVRRFIAASRPDMPSAYSLMTAFPQAALDDDSKTISESGLLHAVIIQKL